MTSESETRKKKGVQCQHKGHSLTRNSVMDSLSLFPFLFVPPTGEAIFSGGVSGTTQNTESLRLTHTLA